MTIGENIKNLRIKRKFTQTELAEKIGISRSYLSDVENNRNSPSMKTVESLAEKLGVSNACLVTGKKEVGELNKFHVVVWHNDFKAFIPMTYASEHETLSEKDMYEIEKHYADFSRGAMEVKTVIISWQLLRN